MSASAERVVAATPVVDPGAFRTLVWLARYPLRRWPALLAVLATMLAKVGFELLKPWPLKVLVDSGLSAHPLTPALAGLAAMLPGADTREGLIGWCVTATVVLFLVSWALGVATAYANIGFGQRMVYDLATDLFSHLQRLSLRFHSRRSVGDSIRRVTTDCGCVSVIVKDAVLPFVAALISFVAMFVVMWRLEPRLTLVSLAVAPWLVLVLRRYMTPMLESSYAQQESEARIFEVAERTLTALPAVQAFGQEAGRRSRVRRRHRRDRPRHLRLDPDRRHLQGADRARHRAPAPRRSCGWARRASSTAGSPSAASWCSSPTWPRSTRRSRR